MTKLVCQISHSDSLSSWQNSHKIPPFLKTSKYTVNRGKIFQGHLSLPHPIFPPKVRKSADNVGQEEEKEKAAKPAASLLL